MPRSFNGSTDVSTFDIGSSASDAGIGPYTFAAIVRRNGTSAANSTFLSLATSGSVLKLQWGWQKSNNELFLWDGTNYSSGGSPNITLPTGTWFLLSADKAAGSATVNYRQIALDTGVETSGTFALAYADITAPGAGGFWKVGFDGAADYWNGDIACVGYEPRQFDATEYRRLARGRWSEKFTRFCVEFPPGSLSQRSSVRDMSRSHETQTSNTGTTINTTPDPPGVRYSKSSRGR